MCSYFDRGAILCLAQKAINLWNKLPGEMLDFQTFSVPEARLCAFLAGIV